MFTNLRNIWLFRKLPKSFRIFLIERGFSLFEPTWVSDKVHSFESLGICQLPIVDSRGWSVRMRSLLRFDKNLLAVVTSFYNSPIEVVKKVPFFENEPILICVQKNDSLRIKNFIQYHRALGIRNFAIIDNGSNDGSFEWLKLQQDVFLFKTSAEYSSQNRDGWINRLLAYFGDKKWYIVLDSDELLTYEDCEHRNINELLLFLSKMKISRARAMMLDMYAKTGYFENGDVNSYLEECVYFDINTYTTGPWDYHCILNGGPRKRLFDLDVMLTKYPLFYLNQGEVQYQSHALFPLSKNFVSPCYLVIRHYKFLPGDMEKYNRIAKEGNYYNGSIEYKKYIQVMNSSELPFFYDASVKYESSASLRSIDPYTPILW